MNLGALFSGIGDIGAQAAQAKMDADKYKLDQLFAQLGLKQGQAQLEETQARTKKLGAPIPTETDKIEQLHTAFKNTFGRDWTPDEAKTIAFGLQAATPKVNTPFELYRTEHPNATYEQWLEASKKERAEPAPPKPSKMVTYDPSGHLREAWVDPTTGEVSAWGPLAEAKSGLYHFKDDDGNIHEVATFKPNIKPGEVRMTEAARKVWENELHGQDHYAREPVKNPQKPGAKLPSSETKTPTPSGGGRIIGNAGPKDILNVKDANKDARIAYTLYLDSMKNVVDGGSKGQLALVIAAAKSSVLGAGRLNLAEVKLQLEQGSYGRKWDRAWEMATQGKLPKADVDEFLAVIKNGWTSKAEVAKGLWKQEYKDKEMPEYLKVPDTQQPSGTPGSATPPPGAKVTSVDDFLKEKH